MTALEKAAAAAYAGVGGACPWSELGATAQAHYRKAARAVLMALREPDEEAVKKGRREIEFDTFVLYKDRLKQTATAFTVTIDAILNEPAANGDVGP